MVGRSFGRSGSTCAKSPVPGVPRPLSNTIVGTVALGRAGAAMSSRTERPFTWYSFRSNVNAPTAGSRMRASSILPGFTTQRCQNTSAKAHISEASESELRPHSCSESNASGMINAALIPDLAPAPGLCRFRPPSVDYQLKRGRPTLVGDTESDMRKIITTTFVTLDGVMQAPGGPEEDASGGFKYGGWQAHVMDDSLGEALNEFVKPPFAMLLGRTTYNIFAGFWPKQDPNNPIAQPFNEATTYVVSHEAPPTSQSGSKRVATTQDGSDVEFLTPSGCREGRAQTVPQ